MGVTKPHTMQWLLVKIGTVKIYFSYVCIWEMLCYQQKYLIGFYYEPDHKRGDLILVKYS